MKSAITSVADAVSEKVFSITTADGFSLSATSYKASQPIATIVIAGATGVPQAFYRRFAIFAAQQGYTTITFDYRGIGKSKPYSLQEFDASFIDWATLDLAAVIDTVAYQSTVPTFMVGHSFGGHAFGIISNHHKISGVYVFGTGAGWHGWMPWQEAIRVKVMWSVVLPALTRWKGFTPMSTLGMGEDLPYSVYQQWKHWCQFPHYFFDDPEAAHLTAEFTKVRTPIIAANAIDDLWAMPRSRDAFMKGYCNAPVTTLDIPLTPSLSSIGHMGYFRANAVPLWNAVLTWFNQLIPTTSEASIAICQPTDKA